MITPYTNPKRYNYLVEKCQKLSKLTKKLEMNSRLAAREFKRWCEMNGLDPEDFYIRSGLDTGYWVPEKFIRRLKLMRRR